MTRQKRGASFESETELNGPMREKIDVVSSTCVDCDLCQRECAFLRKYGKPKDIADCYDPTANGHQAMPFECSLCGLCTAVCPVGVDPSELFLEMRRETVRRGGGVFREHAGLIRYERRGTSSVYSYYGLPESCDTVFFPGCTLSGTRSEKVILSYEKLKEGIPSLGVVLDCCMKPSHDLGREEHFNVMFEEMKNYLVAHGVRTVLVACPNCYRMFATYGQELETKTIYEILAARGLSGPDRVSETVTIHDPCVVRFEADIHESVRKIVRMHGQNVQEMAHSGRRTICCGEGGAVGALAPEYAGHWAKLRQEEAAENKVVTYCAGCASTLSNLVPTVHVLDTLWKGEDGGSKVTKSPLTYWKRLRLKKWFKTHVDAAVARERTFTGTEEKKKGGTTKLLVFLLFLAVVIAAVNISGVSRYIDQQMLRTWIGSYGSLAPIIYMCVYAVAPALFLPGLPITIVGGILFGPFWGVVYAIIGSTIGACVAFIVSRYLAREWVERQLKSPRWRRLDEGVEKHGWKMVAFTRLIPLFPFNLLNYAFGLTKIGFRHYAVATFICMLPACIAFIVFSSSLIDLIRGRVSLTFVIGLILIVVVSLFPLLYRRYKTKRGGADPL
jgi:uncharacterized membrane protein YdjX (TVP38/TMEM64 family)/Fe-S oxidoreductase